ncbi:hypothetical protein V8F20_003272 [Naviculisporaceae sp. PSN 640]
MDPTNGTVPAQSAEFPDDEVDIQTILRQLLDEHKDDAFGGQVSPPLNGPAMVLGKVLEVVEVVVTRLRERADVLCAELLQAMIQSSNDSPGIEDPTVNRFLLPIIENFLHNRDTRAAIEAAQIRLQPVLLELSQKRWYSGEQSPQTLETKCDAIMTARDHPCLTLYVGDRQFTVGFTDVLATFWEFPGRLETHCHACQLPIVGEPPIRTVSSVNLTPEMTSWVHARVTNRHFSCLESSNVLWVPVSHVWEESIRDANEAKAHHDDAAYTVLRTLKTLLGASLDGYGPGAEFWHDYFSVPQWNRPTQQALLLRIPRIYHDADEVLVHLPDLPRPCVPMLLSAGSIEFSATAALRLMPALQALCSSQWVERMWVLVEYSLCRRACIMDKSGYIWRQTAADHQNNTNCPDTFTTLVNNSRLNVSIGLFRYALSFAGRRETELIGRLTDKEDLPHRLCLGEAVKLVARTKCQFFRDKFLAIRMLLNRDKLSMTDNIPESPFEACKWVWEAALRDRDFSPLLLQPRKRPQDVIPHDQDLPSYLTVYDDLEASEWDMGDQITLPQDPVTFDPSGTLQAQMDFAGTIEVIHSLDPEELGKASGVVTAMEILCPPHSPRIPTAPELVDGLNRIFPFNAMETGMAQDIKNLVYTFEGLQAEDQSFETKIDWCIAKFMAAPPGSARRQSVARRVTTFMKYDVHIAGDLFANYHFTRLSRSMSIAFSRRARGAPRGEPICVVRCPVAACRVRAMYRLDLRETAKVGDRVYRFPGLSYTLTAENGVGLVINGEGRITGRMLFDPPSCGCRVRQTVDIR